MRFTKAEHGVISDIVGNEAVPVVQLLKQKKSVSEFAISETLKKEINETRNILYRLHEINLVDFVRKKDDEKGWYVYYWMYKQKSMKHVINSHKRKQLDSLVRRLDREENNEFFVCTNKCARLAFDHAHDFGYKCPECGMILNYDEKNGMLTELKVEIDRIKKDMTGK